MNTTTKPTLKKFPFDSQSGVTAEQLEFYRAEGYLVLTNVMHLSELDQLKDRIEGLLSGKYVTENCVVGLASNKGPADPGRFIKQVMPSFPIHDPVLREMSEHPLLRSIAARLIGVPEAKAFQQQALIKEPGEPNGTPWHQDDYYWKTGGLAVTGWFPLEKLPESGTMSLLPRSHQGELLDHRSANGVSAFQTLEGQFDESELVDLDLELGSISFHHSKLIHGAFPNLGACRRMALAQHYHAAE